MKEFCFECPICKKAMYVTDYCCIRDHAIKHVVWCKPPELWILEVADTGEILSESLFFRKRLTNPTKVVS